MNVIVRVKRAEKASAGTLQPGLFVAQAKPSVPVPSFLTMSAAPASAVPAKYSPFQLVVGTTVSTHVVGQVVTSVRADG